MDDGLYFTRQHLEVRYMVREFARTEVAPAAARHDADATFPWDNIRKMGELGLLGIPWPETSSCAQRRRPKLRAESQAGLHPSSGPWP